MKVGFIVPLQFAALSCRFLASFLRLNGHEAKLIFIPDLIPEDDGVRYVRNKKYVCTERLLELCVEATDDCDVVGFSVLAAYHEGISQISSYVRGKTDKPTIWGGVHPTQYPGPCLEFADYICSGDGEDTLLEFLNTLRDGGDPTKVLGLWYMDNGEPIETGRRALRDDLDEFPFPDFSFKDEWWIDSEKGNERLIRLTPDIYFEKQKKYPNLNDGIHTLVPYKTVTARGCPFFCSYCSMGTLSKKISPFRKRTVENVIQELEQVLDQYGDIIDVISMADDTFLSHSRSWIEQFSVAYKARIDRPLRVIGFPESVSDDKISNLCEAGVMHIGMGIESLSEKTLGLYDRHTKPERVIKAANILVDYSKKYKIHPPTFDIILANPYEAQEEALSTFRRVLDIRNPVLFTLYHFAFFPGSKLYDKAIADGMITKDDSEIFRSWVTNKDYMDPLLDLLYRVKSEGRVPTALLKVLAGERTYKALSAFYNKSPFVRNVLGVLLLDPKGLILQKYVFHPLSRGKSAVARILFGHLPEPVKQMAKGMLSVLPKEVEHRVRRLIT